MGTGTVNARTGSGIATRKKENVDWKMIAEERKLIAKQFSDRAPGLSDQEIHRFASKELITRYQTMFGKIHGNTSERTLAHHYFDVGAGNMSKAILNVLQFGKEGEHGYQLKDLTASSHGRFDRSFGVFNFSASNKLDELEMLNLTKHLAKEFQSRGVNIKAEDIKIGYVSQVSGTKNNFIYPIYFRFR